MFQVGRLCVKIAGRDAGQKCLVVKNLDDNYVLIDGQTRRRKCNKVHLEPLSKVFEVNEDASFQEVQTIFKEKLGVEIVAKKSKPVTSRPKRTHKVKDKPVKAAPVKEAKPAKKAEKKAPVKKTEEVKADEKKAE